MNRTPYVHLKALCNRIETDLLLLENHKDNPKQRDLLLKRIERHKQHIVKCVLKNRDNPLFERIYL